MKTTILILLLLFVFLNKTPTVPPSNESLVNGNFEQGLNIGWNQDIEYQTDYDTIDRATKHDSDPDNEVRVKKHHATLAILPLIILFFFAQKQIIQSYARTGLKE